MTLIMKTNTCRNWEFFMHTQNEIYSVNEAVIDSLTHSLNKIDPELEPLLEELLTICPLVRSVIRRFVLLLSENLRDEKTHLPLCHIVIAATLHQAAQRNERTKIPQQGDFLEIMNPHEVLFKFTDILASQTIRLCALKVKFKFVEWNIEKAFTQKDYLFAHLVTCNDEVKVSPYVVKDKQGLHRAIVENVLTMPIVNRMKSMQEHNFLGSKPIPLKEDRTVEPVFKIVTH